MAASVGLGLGTLPPLLEGVWPAAWFRTAGIDLGHDDHAATSDQAVAVLDAILDGRLYGSLTVADECEYAEGIAVVVRAIRLRSHGSLGVRCEACRRGKR